MRRILVLLSLAVALSAPSAVALTLKEVLDAAPHVAEFKSSPFTAAVCDGQKFFRVGDSFYELRHLMFQRRDGREQSFKEFALENGLAEASVKEMDLGYGPLLTFMQGTESVKLGAHYMLSLSKRSEAEVLAYYSARAIPAPIRANTHKQDL
jgi:hypothetical protein